MYFIKPSLYGCNLFIRYYILKIQKHLNHFFINSHKKLLNKICSRRNIQRQDVQRLIFRTVKNLYGKKTYVLKFSRRNVHRTTCPYKEMSSWWIFPIRKMQLQKFLRQKLRDRKNWQVQKCSNSLVKSVA